MKFMVNLVQITVVGGGGLLGSWAFVPQQQPEAPIKLPKPHFGHPTQHMYTSGSSLF